MSEMHNKHNQDRGKDEPVVQAAKIIAKSIDGLTASVNKFNDHMDRIAYNGNIHIFNHGH